ncbi:MAG TPA: hypothetical protein VF552_10385 [Allosphingosinicella sp.]|jgi:hypothetical protein
MTRIDEALIERVFSPLSGWLEHELGLGRWRAAIECLNGHVAFYLGGIALGIARKGPGDAIFSDLLSGLFWLGIMEAVRRAAFRQAGSSMGVQSARLGEWHLRTILLLMLPASLLFVRDAASFCYTASLAFLLAHFYLKASDTPPPQRGTKLAFGSS